MFTKLTRLWVGASAVLTASALLTLVLFNFTQAAPLIAQTQLQPAPTLTPLPATATRPTSQPQTTLTAPPGDEYIALGDSVAYGVGAPFPEQLGYAGVFFENYLKRVQPNLLTYKNFAIPGETSSSFISRTRNISQLQRTLDELEAADKAGRRVNPITLTVGGNDMLDARGKSQEDKNATLQLYDSNLQTILSQLTARTNGKSDIIVTTYYNPYAFNTRGEDEETAWVRRFNETIKKRANEYKVKIADFFEPIFSRERTFTWISSGDIHPNTNGYASLAEAVWRATGYDNRPPTLNLSFSSLPDDHRLMAGQRASFKLNVQKDPSVPLPPDSTRGAGNISGANIAIDNGEKTVLPIVPSRYTKASSAGAQEFSYLLDTAGLQSGKHILRFEASDSAGNIGTFDLNFEVA